MDRGEERCPVFGITGRNAAPPFEDQERMFDQVTQLVQVFVVWPLLEAVFLWRNDGVHALGSRLFKDRIGIIALVRDEVIGVYPLDQL